MHTYSLFITSHCHLCEQAVALIEETKTKINLKYIEIAEDDELIARYGLRIPVLRNDQTAVEIDWPFTLDDVLSMYK